MFDQSLWVDNKPFQSAMLALDDYNPMAFKKKNAGPSVWVRKEEDKKR
jgi:hypothetical protein